MITKQELIDFYVWCLKNNIDNNIDIRIEKAVDMYLAEKSIKASTDEVKVCPNSGNKSKDECYPYCSSFCLLYGEQQT